MQGYTVSCAGLHEIDLHAARKINTLREKCKTRSFGHAELGSCPTDRPVDRPRECIFLLCCDWPVRKGKRTSVYQSIVNPTGKVCQPKDTCHFGCAIEIVLQLPDRFTGTMLHWRILFPGSLTTPPWKESDQAAQKKQICHPCGIALVR